MEKNIKKLEEIINELSNTMDNLIFNNAGETLQSVGDNIEDKLIIHEARLNALLNAMKKI